MATHVDPRTDSNFEVIRGLDTTAYREDYTIADWNGDAVTDAPSSIVLGEPVRLISSATADGESVYKINDDGGSDELYIVGTNPNLTATDDIDRIAGISFNHFGTSNNYAEPDANENQKITVLAGVFEAKITTDYFCESTNAGIPLNSGTGSTGHGTLKVGADIVAGYLGTEASADDWYFMALGHGPGDDKRYADADALEEGEVLMDAMSIIGKITKVTDDYVYVRFNI